MIDLDEVSVSLGHVTLLAPVSATVGSGDVLVIRGRNGTGKSTLLRAMAGVRAPTSGTVRIGDNIVTERDRRFRRRVAAMIGLPPIAPDLTVEDHTLLVASTWLDDSQAATRLAGEVLEVNEALEDNPALVNQDPYGEGWLVKMKPAADADFAALLDAEAYKALL